jgi:pimeloyl-ACP methyl ester carboxylesterase
MSRIDFELIPGDSTAPLVVVGIHGLMGSPAELSFVSEALSGVAPIVLPNLHVNTDLFAGSYNQGSIDSFDYDLAADAISEYLQSQCPGKRAFFIGVSSGGKIVYDFMIHHSERYGGAVLLDISPAPFEEAEFFKIFKEIVPQLNLSLPWQDLKSQIKQLLPDRIAQVLLASQIYYPPGATQAEWRPGVRLIDSKLKSQRISNQMADLGSIAAAAKESPTLILLADSMSSVGQSVLDEIRAYPSLRTQKLPSSSHFLHTSHRSEVIDAIRNKFSEAVQVVSKEKGKEAQL